MVTIRAMRVPCYVGGRGWFHEATVFGIDALALGQERVRRLLDVLTRVALWPWSSYVAEDLLRIRTPHNPNTTSTTA